MKNLLSQEVFDRLRAMSPVVKEYKYYTKACSVCTEWFTTLNPWQVTCSKDCSKIHRRKTHDTRSGSRRKIKSRIVIDFIYKFKLEHGCSRCSERRPRCLQFHHLDPSKKVNNVSAMRSGIDRVAEEISKCILLCGNCHAVEENGDGYRNADRPKDF